MLQVRMFMTVVCNWGDIVH